MPDIEVIGEVEEVIEDIAAINIGTMALGTLVKAIVAFIICFVAIRIITYLLHRAFFKTKNLASTVSGFLESAIRILLWVLTCIILADILGVPTASLVALVSIVGLALSLSVQNIVANLFSGITLLITKPFEVGCYVDIAGKTGTVKSVRLFYTELTTLDNERVSIPNSDVTAVAVVNFSGEPIRRVDQSFCASYNAPTESVKAAILEAAKGDDRILRDPAPFCSIRAYRDSSIEYVSWIWCASKDYWDVQFRMNELVRESFARHGVEMTYNHLNVHLDK